MNVLSLFDGMSGGQLALKQAGIKYDNYFASEIDINAIKITQHNFPKTIQLGDVCKVKADTLPKIDLLIGGSPCQSFSMEGNKLGFDGKSGLFFEFVRLLKETKPKYFLLENVVMKKEWENTITDIMGVKPIKINSKYFSAQNRPRLYWTNIDFNTELPSSAPNLTDILENIPFERNLLPGMLRCRKGSKTIRALQINTVLGRDVKSKTVMAQILMNGSAYKLVDEKIEHWRNFTILELERLQTVPEGYTDGVGLSNAKRAHAIGNGWTINVIARIFEGLNKEPRTKKLDIFFE